MLIEFKYNFLFISSVACTLQGLLDYKFVLKTINF